MTSNATLPTDRLESFISSIDGYEPRVVRAHETAFRVFARFVSRSLDSRYLDRHPTPELLVDLENLMATCMLRPAKQVRVVLQEEPTPDGGRRALLTTCMPDQNFIFSIVKLAVESLGLRTYRTFNGVVPIDRDERGSIVTVGKSDTLRESFIWMELDADDIAGRHAQIEHNIAGRLEAAQTLVADFSQLRALVDTLATDFADLAVARPADARLLEDNARLLRWLANEHFVFLGVRALGGADLRLGTGRFDDWRGMQIEPDAAAAGLLVAKAPHLAVRKSGTESWVYRAGRTDQIFLQTPPAVGRPSMLLVIEGLFSYQALAEPRTTVPLLDRTIDRLYQDLQATKGTHRYRTIRNAFNSLPLEYLFSLPEGDIQHLVEQVLDVDAGHRSQIYITLDALQHIGFVFVALPRSHYSDEVKSDIRRLLKARLQASAVDDGVYAGNLESVTFHFFATGIRLPEGAEEVQNAFIERLKSEIDQLASPWSDRLFDELVRRHGNAQARVLHHHYHEAFASRYREETSIARAVVDIDLLEAIGVENRFDCDIYQEKADAPLGITRLRMFQRDNLFLSHILPILDNFGLTVIDQFPTSVHVPGRPEQEIATYRIGGVQDMVCDLNSRRNRLRSAIRAVVVGSMSNDPLNRLLLRADIPWPSLVMVLAYQAYARQLGLPYGQATVQEALLGHADIVRGLTEMFRAKFDPDVEGLSSTVVDERRLELIDRSRRALLAQLEGVDDLVSDQVLRTLYNLIDATVRTNFYARNLDRDVHLVLKFDPHKISRMPEPRPYREIFVFHPAVMGLHLRGGPIARGGIRWSDRLLDFRTEVLGLMSTQNLKNVLIVPRGAKGAFVLRNPAGDLAARRQSADEMYKIFIGGLLDVTDNLVGGMAQTPKNVLPHDGPDHYLVVAADKGTAHLSDTANGLAQMRSFWLGDAFASGGSQGYDHKKEAITSRGAWACVRRHFREMNLDPERDVIKVAGIGDMSGDVFGNGLLRSRSVKLIAAFDHRHFFIDPDPDPEASFEARKRLFLLPRSSWMDMPPAALSEGGGIYPRGAKSIKLHAKARAALGIGHAEPLSGPELVQAILKAPVDLLWNGGIGTYIKASHETHLDVGDLTNDAVRVDANEVRAKVLGEGGNLGVTAAGRVQLAACGMRLNTDAVDNSAGVDLSDHEVNLKVLFQRARERGALADNERDGLLINMGQEVGVSVVDNNWLQSRMLSLDVLRSRRDLARFSRSIGFLAERTPFVRRDAQLPDERALRLRHANGEGLYRPELAFLASNAKLDLRQQLSLYAEAFSTESLQAELFAYFPPSLQARFGDDIRHHPLGINIVRTMLANRIIADAGVSWLPETALMTGRNTQEILAAYKAASALLGAGPIKQTIDRLEGQLDAAAEYQVRLRVEDALAAVTTWMLRRPVPVDDVFLTAFAAAMKTRPQISAAAIEDPLAAQLATLDSGGGLAATLGVMLVIDELLDTALLAATSGQSVRRAMMALQQVGQATGLSSLLSRTALSSSSDELDRPARLSIGEQLRLNWVHLAGGLLADGEDPQAPSEQARAWMDSIRRELALTEAGEQPLCNLVVVAERISRRRQALYGDGGAGGDHISEV